MSDSNWADAMSQQTRSELAAERLRLQTEQGMAPDAAEQAAIKKVALAMQVRSRLLDIVGEQVSTKEYAELSIDAKREVLIHGLSDARDRLLKEMVRPLEEMIEHSCDNVRSELLRRIDQAGGDDPDTDLTAKSNLGGKL